MQLDVPQESANKSPKSNLSALVWIFAFWLHQKSCALAFDLAVLWSRQLEQNVSQIRRYQDDGLTYHIGTIPGVIIITIVPHAVIFTGTVLQMNIPFKAETRRAKSTPRVLLASHATSAFSLLNQNIPLRSLDAHATCGSRW
jgi:hypothetical protein